MAAIIKIDNSYLRDKVYLRCEYLPPSPVVLDCYAGQGIIWQHVQSENPDIKIKRVAIEKEPKGKFHLLGNNMAFIGSMNLSRFNVVDLDAYGVPYEQLRTLFRRQYHGAVFITFIQVAQGIIPYALLEEVGFSRTMIKKCPTLFSRHGWEYFLQFLALHGVKKIAYIAHERKHYAVIFL